MKKTVSMEMITPRMDRKLGPRIEEVVERWKARSNYATPWRKEDLLELQNIVKEETNMDVKFEVDDYPEVNAWVGVIQIPGHSGSNYVSLGPMLDFLNNPVELKADKMVNDYASVVIDLDRVWVEGSIFNDFSNTLSLTKGLLAHPTVELTSKEITAVILHELGHVFNQYMTLGDYVYLNYVLNDGVEVLLGNKANVYKLEVLTRKGLEQLCESQSLKKEIRTTSDKAKLRQAILISCMNAPRHHLSGGRNKLSELREEQLADLFASRMGYGLASVSFGDKMARHYGTQYLQNRKVFMLAETIKVITWVIAAGALAATVAYPMAITVASVAATLNMFIANEDGPSAPYDNQYERLVKFRRDIVTQLKAASKNKEKTKALLDDIKAMDTILSHYRNNRTAWEVISFYTFSGKRKGVMQQQKEEQLERLLLNDINVASAKFKTLIG